MKKDDEFKPAATNSLKDDDIKTERVTERRTFLSSAGVLLVGAAALALSTIGASRAGRSSANMGDRKDTDVNRMADSHICDSDNKDARCDNDQRKFADPKSSDKD